MKLMKKIVTQCKHCLPNTILPYEYEFTCDYNVIQCGYNVIKRKYQLNEGEK